MNSNQQSPDDISTYKSQSAYPEEISLVDIIRILLQRKKLIFGIMTIVVCIGLLLAFTQKPVYQVETILLPPSFEDIQPLNVLNNTSTSTSTSVFARLTANANSRKLRKSFFNDFKLIETFSGGKQDQVLTYSEINGLFEGFSKSLKVKVHKESNITSITLEGIYKGKIGPWLDDFVVMANQATVTQLVRDLKSNINSKIKNIKIDISSRRSVYKQRREDELGRLQEAVQIAKELGIHDHLFVPNVDDISRNTVSVELNKLSKSLANEQHLSIYMKGTKVLQAEINALKNRVSDDIHIPGIRDLQEKLIKLEAIKIDNDKIKAVIVDKKATVNIEQIRPNRKLIILLSVIFGGVLGIFGAFIVEFIRNIKKEFNYKSTLNIT